MIVIRGRFNSYGELWFDEEPPAGCGLDVLLYRMRPAPLDGERCETFLSLASDLTVESDALIGAFGGTNRYKVHRADSKDALTADLLQDPSAVLEEFCDFYDAFARQKRLPRAYRRGLRAACEVGQLVLSAAAHGGRRIVWHAYIRRGSHVALLHTVSHFRSDGIDRALVGRANRWLHWKDMLAFKACGATEYDWGGLFADESVPTQASINGFKREFGGREIRTYNCVVACSLKGRVYAAVRSLRA